MSLIHVALRARMMSTVCAVTESLFIFFNCLWSILALETTLRSMAYADPGENVDACGPCFLQKSYISPWSILIRSLRGKETTFTTVLLTADSQLRNRGIEGFCENLYLEPHPILSLNRKPWKITLKNVIRMLKYNSPKLMTSDGGVGENGLSLH